MYKRQGVGITPDNAITRYNLTGSIDWTLTDRTSGARVTGGTVASFTSWSATGSTVAGLAAEEDAALRLMRRLADQIGKRIIASSDNWAQGSFRGKMPNGRWTSQIRRRLGC